MYKTVCHVPYVLFMAVAFVFLRGTSVRVKLCNLAWLEVGGSEPIACNISTLSSGTYSIERLERWCPALDVFCCHDLVLFTTIHIHEQSGGDRDQVMGPARS
jgi:hypothetical protein